MISTSPNYLTAKFGDDVCSILWEGSYWNVNSASIFEENYSRRREVVHTRPALEPGICTDSSEVNHGHTEGATVTSRNSPWTSTSKDRKSSLNLQGNGKELLKRKKKIHIHFSKSNDTYSGMEGMHGK